MKSQDTKFQKSKRILYCTNSSCKTNKFPSDIWHTRTMVPIYCLTYPKNNLVKGFEKQVFHICSECGTYNFENFGKPITNTPLNLHTYIIPEYLTKEFNLMIESNGTKHCLFCKCDNIVDYDTKSITMNSSKPVYKITNCVYKLFIRGDPRRNYVGFLCLNCKAVYYVSTFKKIKWPFSTTQTINPFSPWNKLYKIKQQKDKKYDDFYNNKLWEDSPIEWQELKIWRKFSIEKPIHNQQKITLVSLGIQHTGGIHESKSSRVTVTLENLTVRQAKKIIEKFGSKQQKQDLILLGYT